MKITSEEMRKAIEFLQEHKPIFQQPGDITKRMAAEEWKMTPSGAADRLNLLATGDSPLLERIENVTLENNKIGTVWRIIPKPA